MTGFTETELLAVVPKLHKYAFKLTRSADEREDLVQRALARIWSRRENYQDQGKLTSWCCTIVHNEFVNSRREGQLQTVDMFEVEDFTAADRTDGRVMVNEVARLVSQLPTEQQQVIKLVVLDGLNYFQAADVVGVPTGTVRSRLARGREALRKIWYGDE